MLLLVFAPQPAGAQPEIIQINLSQVLGDIIPQLNAAGANDLVYWSTTELYQWIDEAAQRLARTTGVFVVRDTSIGVQVGSGTYNLPVAQVSTIQADIGGTVLRPRTVQELEALDSAWPFAVGSPVSFVQNTQGLGLLVLYPAPDANSAGLTIGLVLHVYPPTISAANAMLSAPTCIREYFTFYAIAEARAKETKMAMQEVATWMRQLTGWMEQVIESYWGEAQ